MVDPSVRHHGRGSSAVDGALIRCVGSVTAGPGLTGRDVDGVLRHGEAGGSLSDQPNKGVRVLLPAPEQTRYSRSDAALSAGEPIRKRTEPWCLSDSTVQVVVGQCDVSKKSKKVKIDGSCPGEKTKARFELPVSDQAKGERWELTEGEGWTGPEMSELQQPNEFAGRQRAQHSLCKPD